MNIKYAYDCNYLIQKHKEIKLKKPLYKVPYKYIHTWNLDIEDDSYELKNLKHCKDYYLYLCEIKDKKVFLWGDKLKEEFLNNNHIIIHKIYYYLNKDIYEEEQNKYYDNKKIKIIEHKKLSINLI